MGTGRLSGGQPSGASYLAPRELELVKHLARGAIRVKAADDMGISRNTAQSMLTAIYARYEVTNLVELLGALGWLRVP